MWYSSCRACDHQVMHLCKLGNPDEIHEMQEQDSHWWPSTSFIKGGRPPGDLHKVSPNLLVTNSPCCLATHKQRGTMTALGPSRLDHYSDTDWMTIQHDWLTFTVTHTLALLPTTKSLLPLHRVCFLTTISTNFGCVHTKHLLWADRKIHWSCLMCRFYYYQWSNNKDVSTAMFSAVLST